MVARRALSTGLSVLAASALLAAGCSTPRPRIRIPPRVDLASLGAIAMIEFSSPAAEGIGALASREFLAALHEAQPGTPVLELGDEKRVLAALGSGALDLAAIRAIGEHHQVDALVVGRVHAEKVEPSVGFDSAVQWLTASVQLESGLDVRILDTRSGATVWSTAARARAEVARVDVSGLRVSGVGASPPDDAKLRLVHSLVARATRDFWAHWE